MHHIDAGQIEVFPFVSDMSTALSVRVSVSVAMMFCTDEVRSWKESKQV